MTSGVRNTSAGGPSAIRRPKLSTVISQRIVDCGIKKRAENQHYCKGHKYSEPIRQLEINTEHDHRKRPKHGEVSLSEIDVSYSLKSICLMNTILPLSFLT